MVRTVKSYNGEAEDLPGQLATLPAVWVTYGGSRIEAVSRGAAMRYQDTAEFVVMVATRNLRNELAQRQGGSDMREVGSNDLIRAVRRLLDGQRLDLADSRGLVPKAVRSIANAIPISNAAISVYAVEYQIRFDSAGLDNGRFPEEVRDPDHPDHIFTKYQGKLSDPWPWFDYLDGAVIDPQSGAQVPCAINIKEQR